MKPKHINLIFPQWQGGGQDPSTYYGAKELKERYFKQAPVVEVTVSTEQAIHIQNDILGYSEIVNQLEQAHSLLKREIADTIFTIGGGCDANIPAVSYLNHKLKNDLTVLWFDSHGDLNTPQSSPSKNFYGMPLRTLLGEGDSEIIKALDSTLKPSQVILMGIRDLDNAEQEYIAKHGIPILSVTDIEHNSETVFDTIRLKESKNLYIHIDLDVLEPSEFPYVPLPAPNGLKMDTLQKLLFKLSEEFKIIGLGLAEYKPTGNRRFGLFEEIVRIGMNLS
jgi:Arginase/agmatinase/formimionoglutamate hydrolase, arginase family